MSTHLSTALDNAFWRAGLPFRRMTRELNSAAWRLGHAPLSDDERFALALAARHTREGRVDLAAEDFAWLGGRP